MKKPDHPTQHEEDESDISDDPTLSALNNELNSVLNFTDNRLVIFLVSLAAVVYLLDYFRLPGAVMFVGAVLGIAGIACTIFSVARGKQRVAEKYGLVCKACGHRPKTSQIMLVAQTQQCAACGKELNFRKP